MNRTFLLSTFTTLLIAGSAGCGSPSKYVAPRITGRVLDETSRQPIEGVEVRKVPKPQRVDPSTKGAEKLDTTRPVLTDADGTFVIKSEKILSFFGQVRWYSVTLAFRHSGYEPLKQTYPSSAATNSPSGEPLVEAGDITLKPSSNGP